MEFLLKDKFKIFKKLKVRKQRELCFLNFSFLQYGELILPEKEEKYLNILPSQTLRERFFSDIANYLKEQNIEYDDIYIARLNIGETVLLAGLIKEWYKKNNSNKPILILTQKYHEDIFKLYCPDIRYIYYPIEKIVLDKLLSNINYKYGNGHIYYYVPIKYGILSKNGKRFSEYLKELLKIDKYNYSENLCVNAKLPFLLENQNINLDKFVIISPESNSCNPIKKIFWYKLITKLKRLDYSIFCNCINKENYYHNTIQCNLTLSEIYALAQKSKAVIGMRSGLFDYIASIKDLNIFALYNKLEYWNIDTENVMNAYTIKQLPFKHSSNINEYSIENCSIDELIDKIIKNLEDCNNARQI